MNGQQALGNNQQVVATVLGDLLARITEHSFCPSNEDESLLLQDVENAVYGLRLWERDPKLPMLPSARPRLVAWLTGLLRRPSPQQDDERMDKIAELIAHLCGRSGKQ